MISWNAQNTPGSLKTLRVQGHEFPGLLSKGGRYEIMWVSVQKLSRGDLVSNPDGKFRRYWATEGKSLWLTDPSGEHQEVPIPKDGVVGKVLVRAGLLNNLVWMLGASAGSLRRSRRR